MAIDHIRYDLLTQDALRSVVRQVLTDIAKNGLPGEHHFYISFDTRAEGVRLSPRMKEQHPEDITIVLQHQFWDLSVTGDYFEVGLSFGGVPEKLRVPFHAIKGFFDPAVQFSLQFETVEVAEEEEKTGQAPAAIGNGTSVPNVPKIEPALPSAPSGDTDSRPSGEVVRLDRFRKK